MPAEKNTSCVGHSARVRGVSGEKIDVRMQ